MARQPELVVFQYHLRWALVDADYLPLCAGLMLEAQNLIARVAGEINGVPVSPALTARDWGSRLDVALTHLCKARLAVVCLPPRGADAEAADKPDGTSVDPADPGEAQHRWIHLG